MPLAISPLWICVQKVKSGCCWTLPNTSVPSVELQRLYKVSLERKYPSCLHPFLLPLILGRLSLSLARKLIWGLPEITSCLPSSLARKGTGRTVCSCFIYLNCILPYYFPMQQFRFLGALRLVKENESSLHYLVGSRRGFLQIRFAEK